MSSIYVTLQTIALLCIEQQVSISNLMVVRLPRELCASDSVNHTPKCWWDVCTHVGIVLTDRLLGETIWICGKYVWSYLPANWTGRCT